MSFLIFFAALVDPSIYDLSELWRIERHSDNCGMSSQTEAGDTLYISHNFGSNKTDIIVMNGAFKSVEHGKKYRLSLLFIAGGKLDDRWGTIDTTGIIADGEKGVFFTLSGDDALNDIAKSDTLGLMNGDIVAASRGLEGTSQSVPKLQQCSFEVHKKNPIDPLIGSEVK